MHIATAHLQSVSAYSQSAPYLTEHLDKESDADYEKRTWRDRCHVNEDGFVFIPPMSFKNCLSESAKYLSMKIPGKRNATYTKHFEAGCLVLDPLVLPIKKADVQGEWLFVPSDGQRGGTKRVYKCFPVFPNWSGMVAYHILDDTITQEVFARVLEESGKFIGVGRFRPRNNGFYGRFRVEKMLWQAAD